MRYIYLILCFLIGSTVFAQDLSINDIEKKADRDEFTTVVDQILGVNAPVSGSKALEGTLKSLDAMYETFNYDGTKLAVALVTPVLKVKSLFYKLIPLFRKGHMSHSLVVTAARQLAGIGSLYSGYEHWEAARNYIYQPYKGSTTQFTDEKELKFYITNVIGPAIKKMAKRLDALDKSVGSGSFLWDNKLLLDNASFSDGVGRYKKVGSTELKVLISNLYLSLSGLYSFDAYQATGIIDVIDDIGVAVGFDKATAMGRTNVQVNGISHKTVSDAINYNSFKRKRSSFLTLKKQSSMVKSYKYLRLASDYAYEAWQVLKDRTNEDNFIINANIFTPVQSIVDANINKYREVLGCTARKCVDSYAKKSVEIKSLVSNKSLSVNVYSFFNQSPKDLKKFLPTDFDMSRSDILTKKIGGKEYKYRNYERGMAIAWNTGEYAKYTSVGSNNDIKDAVKLFGEIFLGNIMGMVFFNQGQ